jgi:signal peptide peptidase SppA
VTDTADPELETPAEPEAQTVDLAEDIPVDPNAQPKQKAKPKDDDDDDNDYSDGPDSKRGSEVGVEAMLALQAAGRCWAIRRETMVELIRLRDMKVSVRMARQVAAAPRSTTAYGGKNGNVAVIPLKGLIVPEADLLSQMFGCGGGLAQFRSDVAGAMANPDVKALVIDIDSPGGLVDMTPETADFLYAQRQTNEKPIIAQVNTLTASAAYWIASQAHEVVSTPSGETGSIGVYQLHVDESKAIEMEGVKPTLISAGKYKVEGNPFEPLSDEARDWTQGVVDDYYSQFTAAVAKGREDTASNVKNGYGEGRVLTSARALRAGLIDRVSTLDATISRVANGRSPVKRMEGSGATDPNYVPLPAAVPDRVIYSVEERDTMFALLTGRA